MPLVQTCDVGEKPASHFLTHRVDDSTITKSMYNANGKFGDLGVSATRDLITQCDFVSGKRREAMPITFRVPVKVVDIDVLCFAGDNYGIVVATNSPEGDAPREPERDDDGFTTKREKAARAETARDQRHYNSVTLYVANSCNEFKKQRILTVCGEITCMRVLLSPVDMAAQAPFLSAKIGCWPNLLAIGCKKSVCFLGQFSDFNPANGEHWKGDVLEVNATTDALKALTSNGNGRFTYPTSNGSFSFPKDKEQVTSVAYIPCYGVVVVGLSNGCIVLVPLDGKSSITCLTVPYSTSIKHLVVLEPEYDPAGGFYIFSARERQAQMGKPLIIFSHKISRRSDGDGGFEYDDMNAVMIPMLDGDYWINVHGVVKKRRKKEADTGNDTTGDVSLLPEGLNTTQHVYNDGMERTLLFYSYASVKGELKGGLFDLNAYYSRRCSTAQVRFDEYGQDPICSQFTMAMPKWGNGVPRFRIQDISHVHCQSITNYKSAIFDREPLFQPQAADLHLVLHTYGKHAFPATVDSLQYEALWEMVKSLSTCLSQPDTAIAWLDRTGLVHAPATKRERLRMEERPANERVPGELDKIMRAIVSDEFMRGHLIRFIETCLDRKQLLHIGRWMFNELRDIVVRMDESIAPIFDDYVNPASLSKDAKDLIAYCPDFFEFAEQVFWKVRARGAEMTNDTPRLRWVRKMHAQMAFDLRLYVAAFKWFSRKLPMHADWANELLLAAVDINEERATRASEHNHPLFLDALLGRLHEKTMDEAIWGGREDPRRCYPAGRFDLLSMLRMGDAPVADRTALVIYFLNDLDEVVKRDKAKPVNERKGFDYPEIPREGLVRSFLLTEVGKRMDGQGAAGVRERWESDMNPPPKESETAKKPPSKLTDEERAQLTALQRTSRIFIKLQKLDEARMRALMNKLGFGEYRFNTFLIKKGRYREVEDLPVPGPGEECPHRIVAEYAKWKQLALAQKAQLPPATFSNAGACPYFVIKPPPEPEEPSANVSRLMRTENITIRGKTPKKIPGYRRITTTEVAAGAAAAAGMSTPPSRAAGEMARINALMKTPAMGFRRREGAMDEEEEGEGGDDSNQAPDEMARVRDALRTPRSRANIAARAAAAVAGEGTPEDAPRTAMIAPTSILKSAHKDSRLTSAVKSRLRFANVFDEKSISPRERDNSVSTSASMTQPNFDDSYEDDMEHVHSKSTPGHSSADVLSKTRLEREIEEEQEQSSASRRGEEKEADEASMESGDMLSLSASGGEGEGEDVTDEVDERRMEEPVEEEEGAAVQRIFTVYHDSNLDVSSATDEANSVILLEEEEEKAAADAADPKTPPPTPDEEEDAVAAADDAAGEVDEENVSRAVTPLDDEGEKEKEEEEEKQQPTAVIDEEMEEEAAAGAAQQLAASDSPAAAANDATFTIPAAPAAAASNATFTTADATFTVATAAEVKQGTAGSSGSSGEQKDEEERRDLAPIKTCSVHRRPYVAEEETEEHDLNITTGTGSTEDEANAGFIEEHEQEDAAAADPKTPPPTPDEEEEDAAAAGDAAGDAAGERDKEDEEENVSRAVTPIDEEEEKEKEHDEQEKEPEVVEQQDPVEEEEEKEDKEKEEAEVKSTAHLSAPVVRPPPVPKPRTVFSSRVEPISLGLRSYIYMEDGIEKSYEEQRDSSDDEEGEKDNEILARLSPRRRSSSRLQRGGAAAAAPTAAAAASTSRKRAASRTRKESEQEAAGPSTSVRSPRGKKERRDEEEEAGQGEGGEAGDGHLFTTTRTRVVEERYVEREDGVLQHTVKQSTKVIEMTDGVVMKDEQEDKEIVEEEGDREEMLDDADRVTPPMEDAAAAPTTSKRTSSRPVPVGRTLPTASKASTSRAAKKDEGEEKKKREDKATTPLRTPSKTTASRRKLMNDDEDEGEKEKEKQPEEPTTPRRSTRARKPSESASVASAVSTTPSKSPRRSTRAAAKTPSREPSAAPSSPTRRRLVLGDADEEKAKEEKKASAAKPTPSAPSTPGKRGRPKKEPVVVEDAAAAAASPVLPRRRTTTSAMAGYVPGRKRATSETVQQQLKKEEEPEEEGPAMKRLRAMRAEAAAARAAREKELGVHKKRPTLMPVIKEGKVSAKTEKHVVVEEKKKESNDDDDQPSTSQSASRRKRNASETAVKGKQEEDLMKTPSKKKTRAGEKDEDEAMGAGDLSVLRRSTRKAAVTANEGLKTPSKSSKGKQ